MLKNPKIWPVWSAEGVQEGQLAQFLWDWIRFCMRKNLWKEQCFCIRDACICPIFVRGANDMRICRTIILKILSLSSHPFKERRQEGISLVLFQFRTVYTHPCMMCLPQMDKTSISISKSTIVYANFLQSWRSIDYGLLSFLLEVILLIVSPQRFGIVVSIFNHNFRLTGR
jgi:hypothetical protein